MTVPPALSLDLAIGRGDNAPALMWSMPFAVAGSDFDLVVASTAGTMTLTVSGGDLTLDTVANTVSWPLTTAQSAALPLSSIYTLRRISSAETRYYAQGRIFGLDGPVGPCSVAVEGGSVAPVAAMHLSIGRGDTAPIPTWSFPFDIAGSDFELDVGSAGGSSIALTVSGGGLVLDPVAGTVTWPITAAQSAALSLVNAYTLRRVFPERRYYAAGTIFGVDGPVAPVSIAVEVAGPQGLEGPPGPQGETGTTGPVAAIVCADPVPAPGLPVYVDRANGQLRLARGDGYRASFVAGLATAATLAGFVAPVSCGQVVLPDWTAATGAADLAPGLLYYLAPAGGLTTIPPVGLPGVSIVTVGRAADARTLFVAPSNPILQ